EQCRQFRFTDERRYLASKPIGNDAWLGGRFIRREGFGSTRLSEEIEHLGLILRQPEDRRPPCLWPVGCMTDRPENQLANCAAVARAGVAALLEIARDDDVSRWAVVAGRSDHLIEDLDRRLEASGRGHLPCRIVGRLAGYGDVVDMALRQARIRNPDELCPLLKVSDGLGPGIAHRGLNPADELVDDLPRRPLVGDLPFDPLGD